MALFQGKVMVQVRVFGVERSSTGLNPEFRDILRTVCSSDLSPCLGDLS